MNTLSYFSSVSMHTIRSIREVCSRQTVHSVSRTGRFSGYVLVAVLLAGVAQAAPAHEMKSHVNVPKDG